jgi:protein-tyrosine phosphatase
MVCEVLPNIWLGNINDANNISFLVSKNIKCMINVTKKKKHPELKDYDYEKIRIPLNEIEINNSSKDNVDMFDYLPDVTEFIKKKNNNFKSVLIFCTDGGQRAPSVLVGYIMRYGKVTSELAIKYMVSKSIDIFKDGVYFYVALKKFHIYLQKNKS